MAPIRSTRLTNACIWASISSNLAMMAGKIQDVFRTVKLVGYPRVSRVRRAPVSAIADWSLCLRSDADSDARVYAVMIQRNEVADYRLALPIDQCAGETFGPLPAPLAIK